MLPPKNISLQTQERTPKQFNPKLTFFHHQSLLQRFKQNQIQLKHKFKSYVENQKHKFPLTCQKMRKSYQFQFDDQTQLDIREIRKEKKGIIEQLNQSASQSQYLEHRNKVHQTTFYLLKKKIQRVQTIRNQRKKDVSNLNIELRKIKEQIRQQKLKSKRSIDDSRGFITKSRMQCSRKKYSLAEETRTMREEYENYITHQKLDELLSKRTRKEEVKQSEQKLNSTLNYLFKKKQSQADQIKVSRLLRQLAQKQEIKIEASRLKEQNVNKIGKIRTKTLVLQDKIREFRKSLGERRLNSKKIYRSRAKQSNLTESNQQISTNSGFPYKIQFKSYTQEPFDD